MTLEPPALELPPGSRILVIRPGALGDIILSLPALGALRHLVGPAGCIELVGYPASLALATDPLYADGFFSVDRAHFGGLFSEPVSRRLVSFLTDFDLILAWCRDESRHLTRLAERHRVRLLQSDPFPEPGSGLHASEHLFRALKPLGITGPVPLPEIVVREEAKRAGCEFLRLVGAQPLNYLALHPGSGSPSKNWPLKNFGALIQLAHEAGIEIILIEGDADLEEVEKLIKGFPKELPVARNLPLSVLAAVLSEAKIYLGNDSGVTHLAAATGRPTLALFGPTDPRIWAPRGRQVRIWSHETRPEEIWKSLQELSGV